MVNPYLYRQDSEHCQLKERKYPWQIIGFTNDISLGAGKIYIISFISISTAAKCSSMKVLTDLLSISSSSLAYEIFCAYSRFYPFLRPINSSNLYRNDIEFCSRFIDNTYLFLLGHKFRININLTTYPYINCVNSECYLICRL